MVAQDASRQAMGHGLKNRSVIRGREPDAIHMRALRQSIDPTIRDVTPGRTPVVDRRNNAASDAINS
jgi:hypothetical protein